MKIFSMQRAGKLIGVVVMIMALVRCGSQGGPAKPQVITHEDGSIKVIGASSEAEALRLAAKAEAIANPVIYLSRPAAPGSGCSSNWNLCCSGYMFTGPLDCCVVCGRDYNTACSRIAIYQGCIPNVSYSASPPESYGAQSPVQGYGNVYFLQEGGGGGGGGACTDPNEINYECTDGESTCYGTLEIDGIYGGSGCWGASDKGHGPAQTDNCSMSCPDLLCSSGVGEKVPCTVEKGSSCSVVYWIKLGDCPLGGGGGSTCSISSPRYLTQCKCPSAACGYEGTCTDCNDGGTWSVCTGSWLCDDNDKWFCCN